MALKKTPTADARCGTRRGYQAHRSRGERACRACTDAHGAYGAGWSARHRRLSAEVERLRAELAVAERGRDAAAEGMREVAELLTDLAARLNND